jgi:hypothetical protein
MSLKNYMLSGNKALDKQFIIKIAEVCDIWDLKDVSMELLKTTTDATLKAELIEYLVLSNNDKHIMLLNRMLENSNTEDDIKWHIVRSLFKNSFNIKDTLMLMGKLNIDNLLDDDIFKQSVAEFLNKQSLEELIYTIDWSIENYKTKLYEAISDEVYKKSWKYLSSSNEILIAIAKLLLESHEYLSYVKNSTNIILPKLLMHYQSERRELVSTVAKIGNNHNNYILFSHYSFMHEDVKWMIEQIELSKAEEQLFYIYILKLQKSWETDSNLVVPIVELYNKYSAVKDEFVDFVDSLNHKAQIIDHEINRLNIDGIKINDSNMIVLEQAMIEYLQYNSHGSEDKIIKISQFYLLNVKVTSQDIENKHKAIRCAYAINNRFSSDFFNKLSSKISAGHILALIYFPKHTDELYLYDSDMSKIINKIYIDETDIFDKAIKNIILAYDHRNIQIDIGEHIDILNALSDSTLEILMDTVIYYVVNDSIKKNILSFLVVHRYEPAIISAKKILKDKDTVYKISKNVDNKQVLDIIFALSLDYLDEISKYLYKHKIILDKFIYFISNNKSKQMLEILDEKRLAKLYIFIDKNTKEYSSSLAKTKSDEFKYKILERLEEIGSNESIEAFRQIGGKILNYELMKFRINKTSYNLNLSLNKPFTISSIKAILEEEEIL